MYVVFLALVGTAFLLAYFLSKENPVEHTLIINLKIVDESGT
jgi:hypothetical protein